MFLILADLLGGAVLLYAAYAARNLNIPFAVVMALLAGCVLLANAVVLYKYRSDETGGAE